MLFILLLIIGVVTGMLAGLFGVGGGILFTPVLFYLFGIAGVDDVVAWTIGTSLFCTFTAAVSSSIQQWKQKNSFLIEGLKVGLFGAIGVYFGKLVATSDFYTEQVFAILFSIMLLFVAVLFYNKGKNKLDQTIENSEVTAGRSMITGGGGGFVAAIAGVGGGIVIVPVLNLIYKIPLIKAVSVSSLAVVMISFSGWMQFALLSGPTGVAATNYTIGYVDFGSAFPLILGAFAGGFLGVRAGSLISRKALQVSYSALLIFVACAMIARLF